MAAVVAGGIGALIGFCISRFKGDFLIFASITLQMVWSGIIQNYSRLTNGVFGIVNIPKPFASWAGDLGNQLAVLIVVVGFISMIALILLCRSPFALSLMALREDQLAAQSLGISVRTTYTAAFALAGVFGGAMGAVGVSFYGYCSPRFYDLNSSIFFVTVLFVGGSGNLKGPPIGVVVMFIIPELLRLLHLPLATSPEFRQVLFGGLLVLIMYFRPQGLFGRFVVR